MNQKAVLGVLAGMLAFAVARGLVGKKDIRSAAFLGEVAAEVNKQLPKLIDAETELASVAGLEGTFVYNYRLVNLSSADVDGRALITGLQPQVTKAACSTPETRDKFLKQGIRLRYSYADKNGADITSFDVTPADCGL